MSDSLINSVTSPTGLDAAATVKSKDSPEKIRAAASQFEALLISQVLKSAHDGEDGGWLGAGEDESSNTTTGMADEYFARAIAANGGLGLAKMISEGLSRTARAAADPAATEPANVSVATPLERRRAPR
jgi:Rod binding domain-containing protein